MNLKGKKVTRSPKFVKIKDFDADKMESKKIEVKGLE